MPFRVKVRGLMGGWELGWQTPAIMFNIVDHGPVFEFHKELIEQLKDKIQQSIEN